MTKIISRKNRKFSFFVCGKIDLEIVFADVRSRTKGFPDYRKDHSVTESPYL